MTGPLRRWKFRQLDTRTSYAGHAPTSAILSPKSSQERARSLAKPTNLSIAWPIRVNQAMSLRRRRRSATKVGCVKWFKGKFWAGFQESSWSSLQGVHVRARSHSIATWASERARPLAATPPLNMFYICPPSFFQKACSIDSSWLGGGKICFYCRLAAEI